MKRLLPLLLLLWILVPSNVKAQASVAMYCWNPTGSSATNNQFVPCSSTNPLQVAGTFTATVTFPTIGAAVPSTGIYDGINVAGSLRGWTGVNPSGSIYAGQIDLASVAGATTATGSGTATGALRVELPTNGTGLVTVNPATAANWGLGATGAAPPANAPYIAANASGATGGLLKGLITCDQHAIYTGADNGSKTLVAGVSGRKIYICGWLLSTGGTATTLTLYKGTDADCATSGAAIGPPYALLANDKVGANAALWNGFVTATNADYVCVNAGAGNQHTAELWYAIL